NDVSIEAELDVLERLEPGQEGVSNIVEPATRSPVAPQSRNVLPLDLGVVKLWKRLPVLLPLSLDYGPHNLDVLLRHRLRSISRWTAAENPWSCRSLRRGERNRGALADKGVVPPFSASASSWVKVGPLLNEAALPAVAVGRGLLRSLALDALV